MPVQWTKTPKQRDWAQFYKVKLYVRPATPSNISMVKGTIKTMGDKIKLEKAGNDWIQVYGSSQQIGILADRVAKVGARLHEDPKIQASKEKMMKSEVVKRAADDLRQRAAEIPISVPEGDPIMDLQYALRDLRKKSTSVRKGLVSLYELTDYQIEGIENEDVSFVRQVGLEINGLLEEVQKKSHVLQIKLNEIENDRLKVEEAPAPEMMMDKPSAVPAQGTGKPSVPAPAQGAEMMQHGG